ncbi:MAG: VPLPA-CTERM-specific exosortase XrtD [Spongiibacteraceae bacterium]
MNQANQNHTSSSKTATLLLWGALLAAIALAVFIYRDSLSLMVQWWEREEYSHGYMIPLVALFLIWQKINLLPKTTQRGSWFGFVLVAVGLLAFFVGELSALYTIIQYGFLLTITGFALAFFGTSSTRLLWAAFAYLIFMIPLPNFLYNNLSSQLQLWSSIVGVAVIRLFGISVYLEGNVIDLGPMQLQVAEACSGLRYLFPLMSFGFLIGYLYRGPIWQRVLIFLTTVPITLLMNSFRIGVIGVTVDKWGIEMAEGFLHDFEGWIVFMGCVGILFLEIAAFQLFSSQRRGVFDLINLDIPKLEIKMNDFKLSPSQQRPFIATFILLLITTPYFATLGEHAEIAPTRQSFNHFPLSHNGWSGHESGMEKNIVDTLKFSDYLLADYQKTDNSLPVNFYVAWYESQKKGASIHSPRSCIPGGGWLITQLDQRELSQITRLNGKALRVNRAIIQKGDYTNVVYYWFDGRDRNITNEYVAKWFIFWDSLTRSRSDGALIRVVASVPPGSSIDAADNQLQQFLKDFYPLIPAYVP